MQRNNWPVYLWPGLPQLWLDGAWTGLLLAALGSGLLNLLVLSTWVWSEMLTQRQLQTGWWILGIAWAGAAVVSWRVRGRRQARVTAPANEAAFPAAMDEYLRGHWFEAESLVARLLAINPADVEARLLLATVLRRTRRYAEARGQLDVLERLQAAAAWRQEITNERQRLEEVESPAAEVLRLASVAPTATVGPARAA